jgi:hypothetical protein
MKKNIHINNLLKLSIFERLALVKIILQSVSLSRKGIKQDSLSDIQRLELREQEVEYGTRNTKIKGASMTKAEKRKELLSFRTNKKTTKSGFQSLAGIWKGRALTLDQLRSRSWQAQN